MNFRQPWAGETEELAKFVGRTPWSAAGPLAGFRGSNIIQRESGSRGTRADQGVRPTISAHAFCKGSTQYLILASARKPPARTLRTLYKQYESQRFSPN